MKTKYIAWATAAVLLGCNQPQGAVTPAGTPSAVSVKVAYDTGTIKKGDKGHCVVCAVKEGSKESEPVAETVDYQGKTYVFCNESEKAEFIADPGKYATR
jgi:YHS domain-containing protein